jgi:hypothetical protein
MIKNLIILLLFFLLGSLLFQNKENVDILVEDLADTKEMVVDGTNYVAKTFEDKFGDKEFTVDIDIPSMQIQKEPFSEGSKTGGIREDTFFNEEEK